MGIEQWSPIAANNTLLDGTLDISINCPPENVALFTQQAIADIRNWNETSQWVNLGFTFTYISGTSFSIAAPSWYSATPVNFASGANQRFWQYQRIKAVGATTGTIFGTISSVSYSSPTTTVNVTWDSGSLQNEALTIYYSVFTPQGLPAVPYTPGAGSVNTTAIVDGAVTQAKIASGVVGATQMAANAVGTSNIQANAVDSTKLASGLTLNGTTTLTNATITGVTTLVQIKETKTAPSISSGTLTIDLSTGTVFAVNLNANVTTLTLSNVPASGLVGGITLFLTQDATGGRTITWPGSVKWGAVGSPSLSAATKTDIVTLTTFDGGTTWYAVLVGRAF